MIINGLKIKEIMKEKNLIGTQVAKKIGLTQSRLYQILNSESVSVETDTLGKLCEAVNTWPIEFYLRSGITDKLYCFFPARFEMALVRARTTISKLAKQINISRTRMTTASKGLGCTPELVMRISAALSCKPYELLWPDEAHRWNYEQEGGLFDGNPSETLIL